MAVTPQRAIDVANELFGRHRGYRAFHARGTLLKGTFTATPEAPALTRARHMQGESVPATVRFSNGNGNPDSPDYAPDVRGLAVKFYLLDGSRTDIVAQTAPRFPVHTAEGFVDLLRAQEPGVAMAWKLPLFLARHPEAIRRLPPNLPALRPPTSYATCRYYAIHAYRFVDGDGGSRYARYTLVPEIEEPRLSPREAKRRGREYLQQEIRERIADGPVRFTLELQVAAPDDRVDDPATEWPTDRQRVQAGTLEITGVETERETGDDVLVFDPGRVTDGIELSNDPVLRFRPKAYSESVARRTQH
jgi:catalase